jgi:hypothetical protein
LDGWQQICCNSWPQQSMPLYCRACTPSPHETPHVSLQVFNIFTLTVKFFSCALAVGAGLPVGPEGPLIHIGAALGAAISQGHSTTLGWVGVQGTHM